MPRRLLSLAAALVLLRALVPLVLRHPAWGFHIDEFLYAAMGEHLSLFGMQFPPLVPVISRLGAELFGVDLLAARVPAALAGATLLAVVLQCCVALGGGAWAMLLSAIALTVAPVYLRPSVLLHPVIFDQLWFAVAILGLVRVRDGAARSGWWLVGLGLGLGALSKFTVAVYGLAVLAIVLGTPLRTELRSWRPWAAAALALLLAGPTITGQILNGWPLFDQLRALEAAQLNRMTASAFLAEQGLMLGPAVLLVVAGVVAAGLGTRRELVRLLVIAAVVVVGFFLVRHGKAYYAAPAYPPLIAAGAVLFEERGARLRWLCPVVAVILAVVGAVLLPMGVPLLGPSAMARYANRLGITAAVRTNRGEVQTLPQDYRDMLGWTVMTDSVVAVASRLAPAERARLRLVGTSYGRAGALARLGVPRGLPYPVSPNSNFHAWGPGDSAATVLLIVAGSMEAGLDYCDAPRLLTRLEPAWNVTDEIGRVILRCDLSPGALERRWPQLGPRWE